MNIHGATNQSALNAIDRINDIDMTEQQNYKCDQCDSVFANTFDLQDHITLHGVQVIEVTERRKHNFSSLKINEYGQIEDSELDEEDIYEPTDNIVEEMLLHDDEEFPCELCNMYFNFQSELKQHKNEKHRKRKVEHTSSKNSKKLKEENLVCKICHKTFSRNGNLTRHMNNAQVHTNLVYYHILLY